MSELMMDARERMKLLAITSKTLDFGKKLIEMAEYDLTGVLTFQARLIHEQEINAMIAIPASVFRKDRPKLDKRRYKKYLGNAEVIKVKCFDPEQFITIDEASVTAKFIERYKAD